MLHLTRDIRIIVSTLVLGIVLFTVFGVGWPLWIGLGAGYLLFVTIATRKDPPSF